MHNCKRILVVLFAMALVATLVFAGGPKRKQLFPGESLGKPYAEGEVLVKFKKGITVNAMNQIAGQNSMIVKKYFRTISKQKGQEYAVLKSSEANTLDMVNLLRMSSSIQAVSPNFRNELAIAPNDTYYNFLWGMNNTGQTGGTADADIDAPEAWDIHTGSAGNIVAVIDTGLDYTHPDLAANVWRNATEYAGTAGVDDDGNGYIDDIYGIDPAGVDGSTPDSDPMDGYGHGTHCSGTIGGVGNNSRGVVGVNWTVKIMGLKFFDDLGGNGYNSFAIECIDYLLDQKINYGQNVVAINASWGSNSPDEVLYDAIGVAGDEGIVWCASAGNAARDIEVTPYYPVGYDLTNIIGVAATDHNDALSDFSNWGAINVDLAAPGSSIASTVPGKYVPATGDIFFDNMESGAGNWVTSGTNNTWAITTEYETYFGGSYPEAPSTPHFWSDSPGVGGAFGYYAHNTDSYLTYNADIDLSGHVGQDVYFGMSIAKHISNFDHVYLEFSNDSGSNWTQFYDWEPTGGYIFFWAGLNWVIPDSYKTAHFRMRYHFVSDATLRGLGVVIDDIGIGTTITYGYELWDGTSMAAPHVAGAVALMASQFPSETMADRISRILAHVDPIAALTGYCVTGGRLNLFNSISYIAPTITVTSPNGGESWMVSTSHDITWSSTGTVGAVNIDYSTDSGSNWAPIAAGTANDGSYTWTIPDAPGTTCLVRVQEADGSPTDTSDAFFSIVAFTAESVSAPTTPSGPATGTISTSYTYSSGGAISSWGDPVQYFFDWDDGSDSGWLAAGTATASHSWAAAGTYNVRAKARCVTHPAVESIWSATHEVIIYNGIVPGKYNSPAQYKVLPEVIWAPASGGGTWMSSVQVNDVTGGSQVSVYYNTATGRRGPFLLWDNSAGNDLSSRKYDNLLETIDGLDNEMFTYYGTVGAVEFVTQDGNHAIHAAARTVNGSYSKTSSALTLHNSNTADTSRTMIIPNLTNNASYRSSCGFFNPTPDKVTLDLRLHDASNTQVGSTVTKILSGYEFASFSPFSEAGIPYPGTLSDNIVLRVTPISGAGKVVCFGASANNTTNDPAAHVAVQNGESHDNGPSSQQILPEAIWAPASGGGTWLTEVQIVDMSGGSEVSVYFNYGGGNRRGPFELWTGGAAGTKVKYTNILEQLGTIDTAFTYNDKAGAIEFLTQDSAHEIQVTARTLNGNYSKTFPGLNLVDAETADTSRVMLVQNYTNNATYRSTCGFYNPTADSVTVEFTLLNGNGVQIGSTITREFISHDMQAFNPFTEAGAAYPGTASDNVILRVRPTSGTGAVMCFGASANNASNDPASHLAVQAE